MAEDNPNIFFRNPSNDDAGQTDDFDYDNAEFELTDEDARNKVRANIFKALTDPNNNENLTGSQVPPGELSQKIEEELINEFKD